MSLESLHGLFASRVAPTDTEPLIGALVVADTDLPDLDPPRLPVALLNTGGAGQVAGPAGLAARRQVTLASLTTALADPADPAGNVRRVVAAVDAARAEGMLGEDVMVRIELPAEPAHYGWQAAADEIATARFEAALPTSVAGSPTPAPMLVEWIDALLDRETGFAALAATSADHALGVLAATATLWDGGGAEDATAALAAAFPDEAALTTGRRWCRSVHVDDGPALAATLDVQ